MELLPRRPAMAMCPHLTLNDTTPEPVAREVDCFECGAVFDLRPDGTVWQRRWPPQFVESQRRAPSHPAALI